MRPYSLSALCSMMVRTAQGACRPYELLSGGSAIAIECSFSEEILIVDLNCRGNDNAGIRDGNVNRRA